MKWVLIFCIGMVLFITYSILVWRDGYNDGMLAERRKRIRSLALYNKFLWAELDDIKKKTAAEKEPLTFNRDPTGKPIGRVVNSEAVGDGLRFTIKSTEE